MDLKRLNYVTFPLRTHTETRMHFATRTGYVQFVNEFGVRQVVTEEHRYRYAEPPSTTPVADDHV